MNHPLPNQKPPQGILPIDKPIGRTSFWLVAVLRRFLGVKTIGHAGTLDPLASGVMVLLVGRAYTKLSDRFLGQDKEYSARIHLGAVTDTYDAEGCTLSTSPLIPSIQQLQHVLDQFKGNIAQIPPMFSAKKIQGKKLYDLARQGKVIERQPVAIHVEITLESYIYPYVELRISCSKGTYVRSLAHDIGERLGCGAHLVALKRTRSGDFHLKDCFDGNLFNAKDFDPELLYPWMRHAIDLQ